MIGDDTPYIPALAGRTIELLAEMAALRLTGTPSNDTSYRDAERRLEAQIENLTVREARLIMEIARVVMEVLP